MKNNFKDDNINQDHILSLYSQMYADAKYSVILKAIEENTVYNYDYLYYWNKKFKRGKKLIFAKTVDGKDLFGIKISNGKDNFRNLPFVVDNVDLDDLLENEY